MLRQSYSYKTSPPSPQNGPPRHGTGLRKPQFPRGFCLSGGWLEDCQHLGRSNASPVALWLKTPTAQSLAYVYACDTKADADIAKVLMDEARRVASSIAKLPALLGAADNPEFDDFPAS